MLVGPFIKKRLTFAINLDDIHSHTDEKQDFSFVDFPGRRCQFV